MKKNSNYSWIKSPEVPRHLFEMPTLPLYNFKEKWVKHPTLLVEASNNGRLRQLSEDNSTNRVDSYLNYQTKKNIVWCCFNDFDKVPDKHVVVHINGNSYDDRPENLVLVSTYDKDYLDYKKKFFDNTVQEMLIKERYYVNKGFDMHILWEILDIPRTYVNAWKTRSEWALRNPQEETLKPKKKNKGTYKVKPADTPTGKPLNPYRGVCWNERLQKWKSSYYHLGNRLHVGYFTNPEEARDAYLAMRKQKRGDLL